MKALHRLLLMTLAGSAACSRVEPLVLSDEDRTLLDASAARIEQHRTAMVEIRLVDPQGNPVPSAQVEVTQLRHEFEFSFGFDNKTWGVIGWRRYGIPIPEDWKRGAPSEAALAELEARLLEVGNQTRFNVNWSLYEPVEGQIAYQACDGELARWHSQGIGAYAQSLAWNSAYDVPEWVSSDCSELNAALERRVTDFMHHHQGQFDFVVVQNEAALPYRSIADTSMTACMRAEGVSAFVARMFRLARAADPRAVLVVNECCGIEENGAYPALLDSLQDAGGRHLFDRIGLQSHMHHGLWSLSSLWRAAEGYGSRYGTPVHFTELTVLSGAPMTGKDDGWGATTTPRARRSRPSTSPTSTASCSATPPSRGSAGSTSQTTPPGRAPPPACCART